ncbi:hypothetical protein CN604_18545 [Bacillus wiedmannii]|uniref:hypothetical protein n=1 Tax=Bacillus wiedmannii TaxID=1890302 RepID=UPI000BF18E3A|nr:hypothetical protein [Bacillus wiedmannii]PEL97667.1 hypothetical protein CN604_18545 [Bacillus wiedmannii]
MSNLLIHEPPLMVLPSLAKEIGLNEAIVLQQIHYWQQMSRHFHDDKRWIYNSFPKWNEQFPFWSERTLKRIFKSLEDRKLLFVGNYNKLAIDRTKWYSINYEVLNGISGQNGTTIVTKCPDESVNMTRPLPEITTENNNNNICAAKADTKKKPKKNSYSDNFEEIWSIYPKKRNKPKAYQRYKEAIDKNHSHEDIKYGITCYAKECDRNGTELTYIKMMEGFLNDERYLEYKKPEQKQQQPANYSIDNLLD